MINNSEEANKVPLATGQQEENMHRSAIMDDANNASAQAKELPTQTGVILQAVQNEVAEKKKQNNNQKNVNDLPMNLIKTVEQVLNRQYGDIRRNIVNNQLESKLPGTESPVSLNIDSAYRFIQHYNLEDFTLSDLKSLFRSDFVSEYDPFATYFKSLPKWDGKTNFIKKLAGYVTAEKQSFWEMQLEKYLVRAVRCALTPGVPNRTVLVFYGGQDIGKSWYIRFLSPFGKEYYSEGPLRRDSKDAWIRLSECLLINLEELADLGLTDVNSLKQYVSLAYIKERRAYGAEEVSMVRRCSFIGSTNKPEFLIDSENTRWIIVKISDINFAYREEFNIHDAWAQAYALYQDAAYNCELTIEEQQQRDSINQEFEVISPEHDAVVSYLKRCEPNDEGSEFLTKAQILDFLHLKTILTVLGTGGGFQDAKEVMNPIKLNPFGVVRALTKEKFVGGRRYINKKQHRGYYVIKVLKPDIRESLPQQKVFDDTGSTGLSKEPMTNANDVDFWEAFNDLDSKKETQ